jgi:hypothetical protein
MRHHSTRAVTVLLALPLVAGAWGAEQDKTVNGVVEGVTEKSAIRAFRGMPFAAPPVGDLRWKPPQPVKDWEGVRRTDRHGLTAPLCGATKAPVGSVGLPQALGFGRRRFIRPDVRPRPVLCS